MKKFFLSAFVIVAFGLYSAAFRHSDAATVVRPPSLQSTATPTPASSGGATPSSPTNPTGAVTYKDGTYTGDPANAFYGNIQVAVTIKGGQITDLKFLQYPNDRPNSVNINSQAMPYLKQEAIQAQSSEVDIISGATDTSQAFIQSLASALFRAE